MPLWATIFPDYTEQVKARDAAAGLAGLHARVGALLCMRTLLSNGGNSLNSKCRARLSDAPNGSQRASGLAGCLAI